METKVYGIFSGQYSDWNVHGYFTNKDKAKKYCASMNLEDKGYWNDSYYVMEIDNMEEKVIMDYENINLLYEHEIVFDFYRNMRNEPDRYNYYTGNIKENTIVYRGDTWIAFTLKTNTSD